jgi:hypothetical protein
MAGLGRKTFTAGDILTAAQVQGYLQDQAIMVFPSVGARGSAIPSPSEGMFSYQTDTNSLTFYDGANWSSYGIASGGTALNLILDAPEETVTISAIAAGGTVNLNTQTSGVSYYTTNSTANWVANLRGDDTTSLNTSLNTSDSVTHVFLNTNGSPAYFSGTVFVDGGTAGVTTRWQGGAAPTSGNINSVDAYSYTVIKTAGSAFTVLASQTQFK